MAPMVSTEAAFLTAVIDVMEDRNVAVFDVPGTFMQAEIDKLVHVRFTGAMVNMLLQIDHKMYKDYIMIERGNRSCTWSCSRICTEPWRPLICFGKSCPSS